MASEHGTLRLRDLNERDAEKLRRSLLDGTRERPQRGVHTAVTIQDIGIR